MQYSELKTELTFYKVLKNNKIYYNELLRAKYAENNSGKLVF